jgi:HlyD family secretion protein
MRRRSTGPQRELVLYGNVDLCQVELAFNNNERITAVLVQEGDRVKKGETLAHLDTSRLLPRVQEAEARDTTEREVVAKLHYRGRPQEIAEANANFESARADAVNARAQYQRRVALAQNSVISQRSSTTRRRHWMSQTQSWRSTRKLWS